MPSSLIFVDTESSGTSPVRGTMTEFGAVQFDTKATFHGVLYDSYPDPENPAVPIVGEQLMDPEVVAQAFAAWLTSHVKGRPIFMSDNVAWDFMWVAGLFDVAMMSNPFGHSGRRISDFYAGLTGDFSNTQNWKRYRVTPHDHNPVNDALGNVEAFEKIIEMASNRRSREGHYAMWVTEFGAQLWDGPFTRAIQAEHVLDKNPDAKKQRSGFIASVP